MRTTLTLDDDTAALVHKLMRQKNISFKAAVNEAIRRGLSSSAKNEAVVKTPTQAMGKPKVSLSKALQLAGQLEDEELARNFSAGK